MAFFQGILLGVIQGLTEFLPVSSSGHLVIAQKVMRVNQGSLTVNALLHLGTLTAIIVYFRYELVALARSVWNWLRWRRRDENVTLVVYLIAASLPAAAAGAAFEKMFTEAFKSTLVVGIMLFTTGALLWVIESRPDGARTLDSIKLSDSFWVGLAQVAAILPGLSRSGATIVAGMWRGLDRTEAARFSFLLSIPVILGASFVSLSRGVGSTEMVIVVSGMVAAGLSGFVAIAVLMKAIQEQRLRLFAVYCFIMGSIAILLTLK